MKRLPMTHLRHWLADMADAILGPKCRMGCGDRTYPKDIAWHEDREHAGDRGTG